MSLKPRSTLYLCCLKARRLPWCVSVIMLNSVAKNDYLTQQSAGCQVVEYKSITLSV